MLPLPAPNLPFSQMRKLRPEPGGGEKEVWTKALTLRDSEQDCVGESLRAGARRKELEKERESTEAAWRNGALSREGWQSRRASQRRQMNNVVAHKE